MDGVSFVGPLSVRGRGLGPYPAVALCVHNAAGGRTGVTDAERSKSTPNPADPVSNPPPIPGVVTALK
jgi:hypothetical protein